MVNSTWLITTSQAIQAENHELKIGGFSIGHQSTLPGTPEVIYDGYHRRYQWLVGSFIFGETAKVLY